MQQDKALMQINGESFLSHQHRVLGDVLGSGNIYVSGRRPGYKCIEDQDEALGPLEGLRSACDFFIKNSDYESLIVLPVDMPFLDKETLNQLLASISDDVDLICYHRYLLPVLFNNIRKLHSMIELLKLNCQVGHEMSDRSKKFSFKELFNVLKCSKLNVNSDEIFKNINTPEEFNAAISQTNVATANR